ncbi:glucose-1-phosphate adenylyltransferase subunit GlgD [Paenibacillus beijingensis]|uniref:Glucose-1-phosphate adenylyltransferase n=1 Tax=Paenibacillus beijingensis TaxID=1126833 RepID=A0A0D5NQ57_9BACL|nr:glucose-1-phosphate adenylyltransferase subunit GlgD [Paenibacillus beijingensis]AJY77300.1 glucose-1-phosphate adenylyltransferase [Paenibacillus beijingensis]
MIKKAMGVINLIQEADELGSLTEGRCPATVPFGARYRLIDFILSSMVSSGISKVAVFAHTKYRSLMDHLGAGRPWDLHTRQSGLFILPPVTDSVSELSRGDLYHFFQHRDYFQRSPLEYVVISRSHIVCNIDLGPVIEEHERSGADITVVYKRQSDILGGMARTLQLDGSGRVIAMQEPYGRMESDLVSMEIYVMKKNLLMDLVESSLSRGQDHLVRHAILSRIGELHIHGYEYKGYLGVVNTVNAYYRNSMQLLRPEVWKELFFQPSAIYTKIKDEPPTRYLDGAKTGNSLIANGCIIEGTVINSVLFRGVHVGKGAVIRNSIVMQNGQIGAGSSLDRVILDKDARVEEGRDIRGADEQPFMAGKRIVI